MGIKSAMSRSRSRLLLAMAGALGMLICFVDARDARDRELPCARDRELQFARDRDCSSNLPAARGVSSASPAEAGWRMDGDVPTYNAACSANAITAIALSPLL